MVIASSDSCNTLASLDDVCRIDQEPFSASPKSSSPCLKRTRIRLASGDDEENEQEASYLPLPVCPEEPVDLLLQSIPQIVANANTFLNQPTLEVGERSKDRIVYIAQGEVGHVTSRQCDIICSDRATTCHILAFRSSSQEMTPIVSLAHIDRVGYDNCVLKMVLEHIQYHRGNDLEEEKKEEDVHDLPMNIDVYLLGGFADDDARELSNHLLHLLSDISDQFCGSIQLKLQLAAVSELNDDGFSCPVGRGLGIQVSTGEAFMVQVDASAMGPEPELRSARLWSGNGGKELSLFHSVVSDRIMIQPFSYEAPCRQLEVLLMLPDDVLLKLTSTSPDVEEDDFCTSVRSTIRFMKRVSCESCFGATLLEPIIFERRGKTNLWDRMRPSPF